LTGTDFIILKNKKIRNSKLFAAAAILPPVS
jgi:hypothetical protein